MSDNPDAIQDENIIKDTKNIHESMKISQTSSSNRLIGLQSKDISQLPWLSYLVNFQSIDLDIKKPPPPPPLKMPIMINDDQNEESQSSSIPQNITEDFNEAEFEERDSIPIVGNYSFTPTSQITNENNFTSLSQKPIDIHFLKILKSRSITQAHSMGQSQIIADIDCFFLSTSAIPGTYTTSGFPLNEPLRISFYQDGTTKYRVAGRSISDLPLIPFPSSPDILLCFFLYMTMPSPDGSERKELISVGSTPLENQSLTELINLTPTFYSYNSSIPLFQNINPSEEDITNLKIKVMKNFQYSFECSIVSLDEHPEDNSTVVSLTPYNIFYPSPLLTISGFTLEYSENIIPKNSRIYLQASLKSCDQEIVIKAALRTDSDELSDSTSSLPIKITDPKPEIKVYIPDTISFHLTPDFTKNGVYLSFAIFAVSNDKGKTKQILNGNTSKFTKPIGTERIQMGAGVFSKTSSSLSFNFIYPSICAPNETIIGNLQSHSVGQISSEVDPFLSPASIYCLDMALQNLSGNSFSVIPYLMYANMNECLQWVDHFFAPQPNFLQNYYKFLGQSLKKIEENPSPFFRILFKSIVDAVSRDALDIKELNKFFLFAKTIKSVNVMRTYAELLLRLNYVLDKDTLLDVATTFIYKMDLPDRFIVFQILFSDYGFVKLLGMNGLTTWERPTSPFVPTLSVFLSSLEHTWTENNPDDVIAPAEAVAILARTLETYAKSDEAKQCAQTFFPLLTRIYTFHDSLKIRIQNDIPLTPFILFILKYVSKEQFFQYYSILSPDNRYHFFEFLSSQSSPETIQALTKESEIWQIKYQELQKKDQDQQSTQNDVNDIAPTNDQPEPISPEETKKEARRSLDLTENSEETSTSKKDEYTKAEVQVQLAISLEDTWRILHFVRFFRTMGDWKDSMGNPIDVDSKLEHAIFSLLIKMLLRERQSEKSFTIVLDTLKLFVKMFAKPIFTEKNTMLTEIMSSLVEITQRKLLSARTGALKFIIDLFEMEDIELAQLKESSEATETRCQIALRFSVAETFFTHNGMKNIFDEELFNDETNSKRMASGKLLYDELSQAKSNSVIIEQQIAFLLPMIEEFSMFPNISGLIYHQIEKLNEQIDSYVSAFIAQWKLSALIVDVLLTKDKRIPGILSGGSSVFPLIASTTKKPDLDKLPEESRSFACFSDFPKGCPFFTADYLAFSFKKSRELCETAQLSWKLGEITEFMAGFLEKRREFTLLADIYKKAENAYNDLFTNDTIKIQFTRVFIGGIAAQKLGFDRCIRISRTHHEKVKASEFVKRIQKISPRMKIVEQRSTPISDPDSNQIQEIPLKCQSRDIENLRVQEFYFDEVLPGKLWDDPFVIRYTYKIDSPLPALIPIIPFTKENEKTEEIKRSKYFEEQLTNYKERLLDLCNNYEKVLPPKSIMKIFMESVEKSQEVQDFAQKHHTIQPQKTNIPETTPLQKPDIDAPSEEWRKWRSEKWKRDKANEIADLLSKKTIMGLNPDSILMTMSKVLESIEKKQSKPYFKLIMTLKCPDGLPTKEQFEKMNVINAQAEVIKPSKAGFFSQKSIKSRKEALQARNPEALFQDLDGLPETTGRQSRRSNTMLEIKPLTTIAHDDEEISKMNAVSDDFNIQHHRHNSSYRSETEEKDITEQTLPPNIQTLVDDIWDLLKRAISIVDKIVAFNSIEQAIEIQIKRYKAALGVSNDNTPLPRLKFA